MDGNNVMHLLRSLDWSNGGQYPEYRREVWKFYSVLQNSGITPIVIFDGAHIDEQKIVTRIKRRQDRINYINKQITSDASCPIKPTCGGHVLPILASEVYRMTLHGLGIQFYVADGEADSVIARVANHYSCPVLSWDSDFFVFRLVGGYIPFDRFYWRSSVVTADVYYRKRFATQLNFQDCNLFYAIPAIVGNDFLAPCSSTFIMSILDAVPNGGSIRNRIRPICIYLSQFCSLESYTTSTATGRKLKSRCRETIQMYDVPVGLSREELMESTVLKHYHGSSLPHWLIRLFHRGHVPSAPIDAAVTCRSIFHINPDNFYKESSIVAGQIVRQHMYALLQCEEIVEVFRHGLTISGVKVSSKRLPGEFHKVTVSCVDTLSPHQRERLFYTIMQCDEQACNKLVGKYHDWRFVAATVTLWAKTTAPPTTLVKALLLCFIICSGLSHTKLDSVRRTCRRVPVGFRLSHKWLNVMHSFAEWQVIHHTAWTLNALLMEPMSVFSPAFLYDGEIAMYLSSTEDISRLLFEFDIDMRDLYACLEEIVLTGCTPYLTPNTTTSVRGVEPIQPVEAVKVSVEVEEQTCSGFQQGALNHSRTAPCVNMETADFIVKEQKAAGRECITSQIQCTRVDSEAENEHKTKKKLAKEQAQINEHEKRINNSQSHGQQEAYQPINKPRTVEPHEELTRSGGKGLMNTTSRKSDPLNEKANTQKRRCSRHGASEKGLVHSGEKMQTGKERHKTAQDINPSPVLHSNGTRKASTSQVLANPPPIAIAGTQSSSPVTSASGIQKQTSEQRRDSQTLKPVSGKEECSGLSRVENPRNEAPTGETVTTDHAAVSSRDTVQQAHTHTHATQLLEGSGEVASRKQVPELRGKESEPQKNTRKRRRRRQHRAQLPKEDSANKPP